MTPEVTPQQAADRRINDWLRQELDDVPEPTRAVQFAIREAADVPQHRGRGQRLRRLFGFDGQAGEQGHRDDPEVVLLPQDHRVTRGPGASPGVLRREGSVSMPLVLAAMALAAGLLIWAVLTLGAPESAGIIGGGATPTAVAPHRPLDPPGPEGRAISVDVAGNGHYKSLGDALAAAVDGDRILLEPGTYQESVIIDKQVDILGQGDREAIILEPGPLPPGAVAADNPRSVLELRDVSSTLEGFTVRGARHGSSIIIEGGAPTLADLVIDPEDEQRTGTPNAPHLSVTIRDGSSATVRDSTIMALAHITGGASPLLENNTIVGACILIDGEGTAPTIRSTDLRASECPGFSISVAKGASARVEASTMHEESENAGIRIAGEGTSAEISGTIISGGHEGIQIGGGANVTVRTTQVTDAATGIRIYDATANLFMNRMTDNGVSLWVSGGARLETDDNHICDNDANLDLRDGAEISLDHNEVCPDGSGVIGTTSSSEG